MSMPAQNIWSIKVDKSGVIKMSGEIDYTVTPKIREGLINYIEKTQGALVLDLSQLNYLDSSGLAVFIEARRHLADKGRILQIVAVTPEVKKIFQLTQVDKLFGI
jgi:anti-sigma B factor antagonist